ncbi:arsenate reductase ArsC [Hippea maritima]|uniref:Protein tyrosine phosphatase n=1 Tax=Hippea maritima (strain ATCC 700847 / DSM 10411 / MH2) TaxID=760142 RepID=F2LUC8_HIPMA|nr:arsenate reductase ArsC [Hippea maritima]AEA33454.1 protein tyrosine phosphatase [Hippea maritima DSM 10411]
MKKKLLFLCTGNSCRSQMAEAYGKLYLSDIFEIYSAGTEKHGVNPYTIEVLEEEGLNTKDLYSKTLSELDDINFDVVITLCDDANEKCPAYLKKTKLIHKSFKDPAKVKGDRKEILKAFRKVRDEIKNYIKDELSKQFI